MDVRYDFSDVGSFFNEAQRELEEAMRKCGDEAVRYAKDNGTYQNITGNLRRSNRAEVDKDGVSLHNDMEYASYVENRGHDVLSGAALFLEKKLRDI